MHNSALETARSFFGVYSQSFEKEYSVVEIGSKDFVDIRNICNTPNYKGLDLEPGENVDVVLNDPYQFPFEDNSVDMVVSSSCFEHIPMFWLTFLEGLRILKPNGLFYINTPSEGIVHRYPVDCWRFYPDSSSGLKEWANKNNYNTILLESFISNSDQTWKDCVMVYLKDAKHLSDYKKRIADNGGDICDIIRN